MNTVTVIQGVFFIFAVFMAWKIIDYAHEVKKENANEHKH